MLGKEVIERLSTEEVVAIESQVVVVVVVGLGE